MKTLNQEIQESLLRQGAALVGFSDLSDLPPDIRDDYRYGISIAVELNPKIVKIIGNGPSLEYSDEYDRVNKLLNQLAGNCAELLKTKGFAALAKTQSVVVQDVKTQTSKLPHKTVATKSGLGWIGKCALLITEKYGPAIRITSVLTDADLDAGTPITMSKCGKCEECKNICPAEAISGIEWKAGLNRDDFIKALDCDEMLKERGKEIGGRHGSCGLCIWVCPWTQKHLKKSLDN
jgi:epoxyqueuosine reductase QueG